MPKFKLIGGPEHLDGAVVETNRAATSLVIDLPDNRVARYRPGRAKGTYTFRGYDTVIARLPAPGATKED